MKLTTYIIVSVLLFSFSSAANKSITELGEVQIEDLFYNSDSPLIPAEIEKIELYQVDKILEKNEDLELESLEIADIDLITFGEYEAFLNKYYDDNYVSINSKIIKQIEIIGGGLFATKLPFGENAKANMENGLKLGFTFKNPYSFNIMNRPSSINIDFSFSSNNHRTDLNRKWSFIHIDTILETNLYRNIDSELGFGMMSVKAIGLSESNQSAGFSLFLGVNYNIKILKNFTISLYGRGVIEKSIKDIPMYYAGSSVEQLNFGISTSIPIYLTY